MANVFIDIAAEFTGRKAFKKAETETEKLTKQVKQLAKTFGLAFGTAQVIAYGKASVKAAAEDQKAQQQLALALKNVGLGRDAASSEDYIQRLQSEFGVIDDKLRPAYQTLAIATRDTAQAQQLLNLSLDISAATGKDLAAVTGALSKAYLGNNTALSKLGVGISKADLKAGKFEDIISQLETTFAGAATSAANSFQGSIDKLGVAAANVSEIIGTGLIDALTNLGEDKSVKDLADNMERAATYLADVIRGVGVLAGKLKDIPILGNLNVGMIPIVGSYLNILREAGVQTAEIKASDNAHLKSLQDQFKVTQKIVKDNSKLTKETAAQLKARKLQAAIDKANLALNKATDVFDLDKIQVAAALTSQAEQLGKATSSAQLLQITNDTARLNVKKSILALEDAIASKDEAAIKAATNKLNADLGILGTLMKQELKMQDIKSILESLKPKDLINLGNLDAAIAKMIELNKLQGSKTGITPPAAAAATATDGASVYTIPKNTTDFTIQNKKIFDVAAQVFTDGVYEQMRKSLNAGADLPSAVLGANYQARAEQEYAAFLDQINLEGIAGQSLTSGMAQGLPLASALSGARYAAQANAAAGGQGYVININTGIGDPNAIAEAIDNVLREAQQRGTLTAL